MALYYVGYDGVVYTESGVQQYVSSSGMVVSESDNSGGGTTTTVNGTVGNAAAAGLTASVQIAGQGTTVACTVGNAAAAGLTATVTASNPTTISCTVGNAAAAGLTAAVANQIMSDVIINNTGSIRSATAATWFWYAGGFTGAAATSTGSGTTNAAGRLLVPISYAAGDLIIRMGADVYFEPFA